MNSEERFWINQSILFHKDVQYSTGNSLELNFSSSTQDFQTFSSPTLNLSIITSSIRKVFPINYQLSLDLTRAFKQGSESNFTNFNIYRKSGDRLLKIEVHQIQDSKEWVATINIVYSSTDSVVIVLPLSVFFCVMSLIKDFTVSYLNLTLQLSSRTLLTELVKEVKEVKSSIKALPSFIKETTTPNVSAVSSNLLNSSEVGPSLVEEFSSFIDDNIDKIKIPEIDRNGENLKVEKIESWFISEVLKNDISVFEDLFNSASVKMDTSIFTFRDILTKNIKFEDVDFLPGISESELKSILLVTKVFFGKTLFSFVNSNRQIPKGIPIIKYQVDSKLIKPINVDLAYDLLLVSGYLRLVKNQLEEKIINQVSSKSFLYLTVRSFTDPFTFSFLEDKDSATIKSCVLSRFRLYQKNGFFKKYEFLLKNYGCKDITESDIESFLDEVCTKVIRKSPFIREVHEKSYLDGDLLVPFENQFSVEQIINEVAFLEIARRVGIDIASDADLSRLVNPFEISDEIRNLFSKNIKIEEKKDKDKEEEKETNIVRFVKFYKQEIPEKFRDSFLDYLRSLKYQQIDLNNPHFPLEEMGESIVKGLYVWNEMEDRVKVKYTDFYLRFETCLLNKNLIMSRVKGPKSEEPSENWLILSESEIV